MHRPPTPTWPAALPGVRARGVDRGRGRHCSAKGGQRGLAPRRRLAAATGDTPSRRPLLLPAAEWGWRGGTGSPLSFWRRQRPIPGSGARGGRDALVLRQSARPFLASLDCSTASLRPGVIPRVPVTGGKMAALSSPSWLDELARQAEEGSARLREMLSVGLGFLRTELGLDLGLEPKRYPGWVILVGTGALGLLLLLLLGYGWAAACAGARKKRRSPPRKREEAAAAPAPAPDDLAQLKNLRSEEQKKKNRKKLPEKPKVSRGTRGWVGTRGGRPDPGRAGGREPGADPLGAGGDRWTRYLGKGGNSGSIGRVGSPVSRKEVRRSGVCLNKSSQRSSYFREPWPPE